MKNSVSTSKCKRMYPNRNCQAGTSRHKQTKQRNFRKTSAEVQ